MTLSKVISRAASFSISTPTTTSSTTALSLWIMSINEHKNIWAHFPFCKMKCKCAHYPLLNFLTCPGNWKNILKMWSVYFQFLHPQMSVYGSLSPHFISTFFLDIFVYFWDFCTVEIQDLFARIETKIAEKLWREQYS